MIHGATPVNEGQRRVVDYLRNALPNTYTLIPNFQIAQHGHPPYEYDLAVIASHAVYVVEIKDWPGYISGDDSQWRIGSQFRDNPWPTANNKARVLKSLLGRQVSSDLWVEALVVIA